MACQKRNSQEMASTPNSPVRHDPNGLPWSSMAMMTNLLALTMTLAAARVTDDHASSLIQRSAHS